MITYEAISLINATPEAVWSVMIDGSRYSEWDFGITLLDGEVKASAKIQIESETSPGNKFTLKVTEVEGVDE